jgi:hypothetical protein
MARLSGIIDDAIGRKDTWPAKDAYKSEVIRIAMRTPEADWHRPVMWKELPQFLGAHPETHFEYMENSWNYLDSLSKWTKKAREQHAAQPWPSDYAGDAARKPDTAITERCFRVAARTSSTANGGIQEVPWAYVVAPDLSLYTNAGSLHALFNFDRDRWGIPEQWSDQIVAMNRRRSAYVETTRRSWGLPGDGDEHKMYGSWVDAGVFYGWRRNEHWPHGLSELPKSRVYDIDAAWKLRAKIAMDSGLIGSNGVEIGPLTPDERKNAFFAARLACEWAGFDLQRRYDSYLASRLVDLLTRPDPDQPFVKGYSHVRALWYAQWLFALSGGAALLSTVKKVNKGRLPDELNRMIDYMKIKPVKSGDL